MTSILKKTVLAACLTPTLIFANVNEPVSFQKLVDSDTNLIGVQLYMAESATKDKDYNSAASHYIRAIKLGLPEGTNNLAEFIENDYLLPDKVLAAAAEIKKTAGDNAIQSAFLGRFYKTNETFKNDTEAFKWFNNAMRLGDVDSLLIVADYILDEKGGAHKVYGAADALTLLKQYSDKTSDPIISLRLAKYLYQGQIIHRDYKASAKLFKIAAEGQVTEGFYWLGYMHEKGIGVAKNVDLAREYYINSLGSTTDKDAYFQLARMSMYNEADNDMVKGLKYLKKAHQLGNVRASYRFGTMYLYGIDNFKVDSEQAIYYLDAAAQNGYRLAIRKLIDIFKNGVAGVLPSHQKAREYEKLLKDL